MMDERVIFLHIPKTGGMTMRQLLNHHYDQQHIFKYPARKPIQAIQALTTAERSDIECVYGHLRFGVHRHFPGSSTYITLLRDPLDRLLSMYYYVRSRPQNRLYDKVKHLSFAQFVTSPDPQIQTPLQNHQTRMISGRSQPDLQVAKRNIRQHFAVVGITESFPESVFIMKKILGWRPVPYTKENVTKRRPRKTPISQDLTAVVEKNNALDYQLYQHAKKRLMNQIHNLRPREKQQLRSFKQQV